MIGGGGTFALPRRTRYGLLPRPPAPGPGPTPSALPGTGTQPGPVSTAEEHDVMLAAAVEVPELSSGQFDGVYNLFSLAIASLGFTGLYLVLAQRRVLPRYRNAVIVSAMVCFIATYHYVRIFENF